MKFTVIWRYVGSVKSTVKISSIFVAFLENTNFNSLYGAPSLDVVWPNETHIPNLLQ